MRCCIDTVRLFLSFGVHAETVIESSKLKMFFFCFFRATVLLCNRTSACLQIEQEVSERERKGASKKLSVHNVISFTTGSFEQTQGHAQGVRPSETDQIKSTSAGGVEEPLLEIAKV